MRFASHRDIARAVERGVRRAGLPVAHSAGFSPHPKISYSGGAPTGAASEAEFLEIYLAEAQAPRLEASEWEVVLPGVTPEAATKAVEAFLAAAHAEVERLTSNGVRRLDTRAGVVTLELDRRATAEGQQECAILRMVVRHLTPAVRPEDILAAFRAMSALEPSSPAVVTRLAQGPLGTDIAADGLDEAAITAEAPRPDGQDAAQGQVLATCLDAEDATMAGTAPVSAYEQLPRGAERPDEAGCAREPDGRDRPNARDRATEQRAS
jgi:hypothetical protein